MWEDDAITMPCPEVDEGAKRQTWGDVEDQSLLPYRPLLFEDVSAAIDRTRPMVGSVMIELHENFTIQYCLQQLYD